MVFAKRYRLIDRLGRGGMGEVYRADDLRLGQKIALKFLFRNSEGDPRSRMRFRAEADLARRVSHSGVCRIFDFGEAEGHTYVAMESIEGENLAQTLRRVGRLPIERTLELALELCDALGAIHEEGILHGDLKPANVMLDHKGRARILDFGVARTQTIASQDRSRAGTPAYMAPEIARGSSATQRSDLYSLGLVLWELATGERLDPQLRQEPPLLSSKVDGVHPTVDRLLARLLSIDPIQRPASAESIAVLLRKSRQVNQGAVLRTIVASEDGLVEEQDTSRIENLLETFGGKQLWDGLGRLWLFERSWDAVSWVLAYQKTAPGSGAQESTPAKMALEVNEVVLRPRNHGEPGTGELILDGNAAPRSRAMIALAVPGQILLDAQTYYLARRIGQSIDDSAELTWLFHGSHELPELQETTRIFEVGRQGLSPLQTPPQIETAVAHSLETTQVKGWRPAPGVSIPLRTNFQIERQLGRSSSSTAWLARHLTTGDRRVYKFCFDTSKINELRQEIRILQLLRKELGEREDIAKIIDWNLEHPPFFIESEYTMGGGLDEWLKSQGGVEKVPTRERLELVAQASEALAAAHAVGVLHKGLKPSKILITNGPEGELRVRLSDFGVGSSENARASSEQGSREEAGEELGNEASYLAPEVEQGGPSTIQSDIYALGVILLQLVVEDFSQRPSGGRHEQLDDRVLAADIAAATDENPLERLQEARQLAHRLRNLESRKSQIQEQEKQVGALETQQRLLAHAFERRKVYRQTLGLGLVTLILLSALTGFFWWQKAQEAQAREEAEQLALFLEELFVEADPFTPTRSRIPFLHDPSVSDLLKNGAERLEGILDGEPRTKSRLLVKLGTALAALGEYEIGTGLIEESSEIRSAHFGDRSPEVAESLDALGVVLTARGFAAEGEERLWQALEIRRAHLPENHPAIADSLDNLGINLIQQSRFQDSEAVLNEALGIRHHLSGASDAKAATTLNNLAIYHFVLGRYSEAESGFREALGLRRRLLDDYDLAVAESLGYLADTLIALGSFSEAEALSREALEIQTSRLGTNHPEISFGLNRLAMARKAQGDYAEAETLHREALRLREHAFGEMNQWVATSLNNLAAVLRAQKKYHEAEGYYRRALAILQRLYGDSNGQVALVQNNLAVALAAQGLQSEALVLLQRSLASRRSLGGSTHPTTAISLYRLAEVQQQLGDLLAAFDSIQEAQSILEKQTPRVQWRLAYVEGIHGSIKAEMGRMSEAEELLLRSYSTLLGTRGPDSIETQETLERLREVYRETGRSSRDLQSKLRHLEGTEPGRDPLG